MAGRVVDSLSVLLTMNTRAFDRAMSGVSKSLSVFRRQIFSVAGVYGIGRAITSTVELSDRLTDLSARLGIPPAQLNQLRRVSELAGVDLESLAKGMAKLSIELQGNSKDFAKAIQTLGLSRDQLLQMSQAERLVTLSEAFEKITDETEALATAGAIFGPRFGQVMLQVFREVGAQAEETRQKLKQATDGMTDEQHDALGKLADKWTDFMNELREQLGKSLMVSGLADFISWLTEKMKNLDQYTQNIWARVSAFATGAWRTAQSFMGGTSQQDAIQLRSEAGMWFSNAFAGSGLLSTMEGLQSNSETSSWLLRQIEQNTRVRQINGVQLR